MALQQYKSVTLQATRAPSPESSGFDDKTAFVGSEVSDKACKRWWVGYTAVSRKEAVCEERLHPPKAAVSTKDCVCGERGVRHRLFGGGWDIDCFTQILAKQGGAAVACGCGRVARGARHRHATFKAEPKQDIPNITMRVLTYVSLDGSYDNLTHAKKQKTMKQAPSCVRVATTVLAPGVRGLNTASATELPVYMKIPCPPRARTGLHVLWSARRCAI